jgi:tRNA (guanine-N7-)-methyltransferase
MSRTTPRRRELPPAAALLPEPQVSPADLVPPLDLARLFGRGGPVEVEVGFGKGRFLLAEAAARPGTNFLGIEHALPYLRLVRHRALAGGLANVRLVAANARDIFDRLIPDASLAAVRVLFPDPWPKRSQHGRRLVDREFAAAIARALVPGGALDIVTDNADYAVAIFAAVAAVPSLAPEPASRLGELAGRTHYATKLAPRGATFHAHSWIRRR